MEGILTKGPDPRLRGRLIACGQEAAPLLLCIHGGGCNGGYFDMRGFSVAQVATARGFDVLLIDRPGHGASAPPRTLSPIAEAAELLPSYIASILAARASPDLVVIGHSIGGAVALLLAANGQTPIRGVAVSGIGRIPSDRASAWLAENAGINLEPPPEFFFGPKGSYDWRGPLALRRVVEPWRADELEDVRVRWPVRFDAVAGAVTAPVAFHLAEHECIWRADAAEMAAAASRFLRSQRIEAGILPEGGHLYELHKQGMKLTEQQLDFLIDACFDGEPQ